jgi:hypothetical protein
MLHVSTVPYVEELIIKKFDKNFEKFYFELLENPFAFIPKYIESNSLLYYALQLHFKLDPAGTVSRPYVKNGYDEYNNRINKQTNPPFSGKDGSHFTIKKKDFTDAISEVINSDRPVVAVRYRRPKANDKLKLVVDSWYYNKTDSSTLQELQEQTHYEKSINSYQPMDGKGRNLGICHKIAKGSTDETTYFNAWLNKFFIVTNPDGSIDKQKTDNLYVHLHMIFDGDLINIAFSNSQFLSARIGFERLIDKYLSKKSNLYKFGKDIIVDKLDTTFQESFFNEGQACCPPA